MRSINARKISEAVGTVALVLLVLLPSGFGTTDDVSLTNSDDCGDSRGCGGNTHHGPDANPAGDDVPRLSRQQLMDRIR